MCYIGFSWVLQQNILADVSGPLKNKESVDATAFRCSASTDGSLHYMIYLESDRLCSLFLNPDLCREDKEGSDLL